MSVVTPNIQVWSYSHNPASSDKDAVRFNVGDTNSSDKLLDDNEILYSLAEEGNVRQASIACLQTLITVYSRFVDKTNDKLSDSNSQRVASFEIALNRLLERQGMSGLQIFAGGQSISGKVAEQNNTDRVAPAFTRSMMNNPRAVFADGEPSGDC